MRLFVLVQLRIVARRHQQFFAIEMKYGVLLHRDDNLSQPLHISAFLQQIVQLVK
jgi:hypothetical protein